MVVLDSACPAEEIAPGVYVTDGTKQILYEPACVRYHNGALSRQLPDAFQTAVASWYVRQAHTHHQWVGLSMERAYYELPRFCREQGIETPADAHAAAAALSPHLRAMKEQGLLQTITLYDVPTRGLGYLVLEPTAELVSRIVQRQ